MDFHDTNQLLGCVPLHGWVLDPKVIFPLLGNTRRRLVSCGKSRWALPVCRWDRLPRVAT